MKTLTFLCRVLSFLNASGIAPNHAGFLGVTPQPKRFRSYGGSGMNGAPMRPDEVARKLEEEFALETIELAEPLPIHVTEGPHTATIVGCRRLLLQIVLQPARTLGEPRLVSGEPADRLVPRLA